jgi:hypothetical protein
VRAEGARFAFITHQAKKGIAFFADGERHELQGKAAQLGQVLANSISIPTEMITKHLSDTKACSLLAGLLQRGLVVLE